LDVEKKVDTVLGEELLVVGKSLPRWKAHEKVTGSAKFTVDFKLPEMLVGKVLTSPHAHANIKKIDTSRAEKLPGVEAVITFEDVPKKLFNPNKLNLSLFTYDPRYDNTLTFQSGRYEIEDMYVLSEKARFVGDRIAAVAAINERIADEALGLIDVEYEVLPAVFDPVEAIKPGAPRIHEFAENNIAAHIPFPGSRGDMAQGFNEAGFVVEETFRSSRQQMCQFEPSTCIASFDSSGRLTIWSLSQHVFLHRRKLAELFDMPIGMVRWITLHVGSGWGKFGSFSAEPVCVVLAKKTGKPVKLEYTREEDFLESTRQTYVATGKVGVRKDGTMTALQEKLLIHGGAYFTHNSSTTGVNMGSFAGLYKCPNVTAEADAIYTNIQPTGGVRGYGNSEAMLVLEQLVDIAAEKLKMDPLELRLKNMKKAGDPSNTGLPMETFPLDKCIKIGARKIGWKEKREREKGEGVKRYGIGVAVMMHVSGAQPWNTQHRNVLIKFNEDGSASLIVSACDMGQNLLGTLSQIAAEVLGIRYEDIIVSTGDTDSTLFDQGQHASGGLYQIGNAVIIAATEVKKQLLERAAKKMGVAAIELDVKDRRIYVKAQPEKAVTVAEITKDAIYNFEGEHLNLFGKGSFSPTQNPPPSGVVFAEVEVDTETGEVKVLKLLFVNDMGRAINPQTVEGQMEGGMSQGIGYALYEDYFINQQTGVVESDNFTTYKILAAQDMPELEVVLYEEPVPSGPFGAKGVGENPMVAVAPAIANAVYNAVGVRILDIPITPEKILKHLKSKSATS